MLKSEKDITELIQQDEWMMEILRTAKLMDLPGWWICAGFVRSKIWDVLHEHAERTPLQDIDVIYFDDKNIDEREEKQIEVKLKSLLPDIPWSVKNEARMHIRNRVEPYTSATDAIAKFPETATALGVKLDSNNKLVLTAPHGIDDVINLIVTPTPYFAENNKGMVVYEKRVHEKNWKLSWDRLIVNHYEN